MSLFSIFRLIDKTNLSLSTLSRVSLKYKIKCNRIRIQYEGGTKIHENHFLCCQCKGMSLLLEILVTVLFSLKVVHYLFVNHFYYLPGIIMIKGSAFGEIRQEHRAEFGQNIRTSYIFNILLL